MRFLFIVGCGHSGTGLMLAIFANCRNVHAITNETEFLFKSSIKEFKRKFDTLENTSAILVAEKTPRHVYRLGKITSDEQSSALVMLRNPIDVVASLKKRGFPLIDCIRRYRHDNNAWLKYQSKKKVKILKYEELVTKTEEVLENLGQEYGLNLISANEKRLTDERLYFTNRGPVQIKQTDGKGRQKHNSLRNFQIRQEIKNMNGQWKERLTDKELRIVIEELNYYIKLFKYEECFDYKI
tara:strand:+ start:271 stop:990 length:720 start_codon:yes stop_codon:yes gene_type:complete